MKLKGFVVNQAVVMTVREFSELTELVTDGLLTVEFEEHAYFADTEKAERAGEYIDPDDMINILSGYFGVKVTSWLSFNDKEPMVVIFFEMSGKQIASSMDYHEQDDSYRHVWNLRVQEDIESYAETMDIEVSQDEIKMASELYVYDGEYDCNLDYWANIGNLIDQVNKK